MKSMRDRLLPSTLSMALVAALGLAVLPSAQATPSAAAGVRAASVAMAPTYQRGYVRQQVRVARPVRNARWTSAPRGAVRVYHRSFDPRWQWRSAPRYRVMYTQYRGDTWFLDPTTGWAYSVDRYGFVYTADPYRGWVYSLGPMTRWTSDLLYFFDLYRFDRGYWNIRDYDYFEEVWYDRPRYGYYTYDTAYSSLWGWERYWHSPTFVSYTTNITNVFITEVRQQHVYIDRHPRYRQEIVQSIGRTAVAATPPPSFSPQAIATSSFWEARDLAAAGVPVQQLQMERNTVKPGEDLQSFAAAGTVVDTSAKPLEFVPQAVAADPVQSLGGYSELPRELKPVSDAPIADAPVAAMPEYVDSGAKPGAYNDPGAAVMPETQIGDSGYVEKPGYNPEVSEPGGQSWTQEAPVSSEPEYVGKPIASDPGWNDGSAGSEPQYQEPAYEKPEYQEPSYTEPQYQEPAYQEPKYQEPAYEEPRYQEPSYSQPQYQEPAYEEPKYQEPSYSQPQYQEPAYEEPKYQEPTYSEPRYEEPRYEAPSYSEPAYEAPKYEEPRYEAPSYSEPAYEAPQQSYEEPKFEAPQESKSEDSPWR